MLKPDFGPLGRRIDWTDDRVAYVRFLAEEQKKSARAIAEDIGLPADVAHRINAVCKRNDIALTGQAGRPRLATAPTYRVAIVEQNAPLLAKLAQRHSFHPAKVAELLLNAAFEQGEAFCENMLDLGDA